MLEPSARNESFGCRQKYPPRTFYCCNDLLYFCKTDTVIHKTSLADGLIGELSFDKDWVPKFEKSDVDLEKYLD